jgi:Fe2+ or Zn2+ uptake regulation protein
VAAELTYSQKRVVLRNARSSRPKILAAFRHRNVRCTPHPTAEETYQAINRTDPRALLATAYKSLHARAGLIREVTVEGNAVRFESNMDKHHHFVCERCGRVEDISWFEVPALSRRTHTRSV